MLKLNLQKEPYWLELPAQVRVKVRPLSSAVMQVAQNQAVREMLELRKERAARLEAGTDVTGIPDIDDPHIRNALSETLLINALARQAILEWEGVMLPDSDAPAPVNAQTVADLMDIWFIAQEFWKQYTRSLDLLEIEGNGSRPVANGTSAAGRNTVGDARKRSSRAPRAKQVR
jgi:hypothetical protein